MQYEVRISPEQGTYIVASGRDFEDILIKDNLTIKNHVEIEPGQFTTLHNWFDRPCMFVGFLPNETSSIQLAIFFLGEGDSDLFGSG